MKKFVLISLLGAVGFGLTGYLLTQHANLQLFLIGAAIFAAWHLQVKWEQWLLKNQPDLYYTSFFTFIACIMGSTYLIMHITSDALSHLG
jgi:hypothetical protein